MCLPSSEYSQPCVPLVSHAKQGVLAGTEDGHTACFLADVAAFNSVSYATAVRGLRYA
jgi:hypothetical protein